MWNSSKSGINGGEISSLGLQSKNGNTARISWEVMVRNVNLVHGAIADKNLCLEREQVTFRERIVNFRIWDGKGLSWVAVCQDDILAQQKLRDGGKTYEGLIHIVNLKSMVQISVYHVCYDLILCLLFGYLIIHQQYVFTYVSVKLWMYCLCDWECHSVQNRKYIYSLQFL